MEFVAAQNQPPVVEIKMADGIFIKQMFIESAGTYIPTHAHMYDHVSMLARGSVRLWRDGVLIGDFVAPKGIDIPAKTKHTFLALEDSTTIYCIHNIKTAESVEILEEHHLVGAS
jgi:hypothetical protein